VTFLIPGIAISAFGWGSSTRSTCRASKSYMNDQLRVASSTAFWIVESPLWNTCGLSRFWHSVHQ
jgi:hypothetical protein